MALGSGIPLTANFDVFTNQPLDARTVVEDIAERDALPDTSRYEGLTVYVKSEQVMYTLKGGITNDLWSVDVGGAGGEGGGGSSEKNYLQGNHDAEDDEGDWTTFHDGASLVDGTGYDGDMYSSFGVTPINPLRGTQSYIFYKAGIDQANAGFSIDFTLDNADKNKNLYFSCDFEADSSYVVDDLKWAIYEKTTGTLYKQGGGVLKATSTPRRAQFVWPAGTDTDLRLICYVANTNENGYDVKFDNMRLVPTALLDGPVDRQVEISLAGSGDFTAGTFRFVRTGGIVHITQLTTATFASSAAPASAAGILPEWLRPAEDIATNSVATGAPIRTLLIGADGTVQMAFRDYAGGTSAQTSITSMTGTYSVSDTSSALMSTTALMNESAKVMLTSSNGPAIGTSFTKITFNNIVQDSLGLVSSGTFTAPATLNYDILGHLNTASVAYTAGQRVLVAAYVNGVSDKYIGVDRATAAGTTNREIAISGTVHLNKGDTLEIYAASSVATTLESTASGNHISIQARPDLTVYGAYFDTDTIFDGIKLRRPDGTVRRITIDNSDNIIINSVE